MIREQIKKLKIKIKTKIKGEPLTEEYSLYSYKITMMDMTEYKLNNSYFIRLPFGDFVESFIFNQNCIEVADNKFLNVVNIKYVEFVGVVDSFKYTRAYGFKFSKPMRVGPTYAERLRNKNDW